MAEKMFNENKMMETCPKKPTLNEWIDQHDSHGKTARVRVIIECIGCKEKYELSLKEWDSISSRLNVEEK